MRLIREGDRGPAVEDVQRRLLLLDLDIGPTGVDGVFLGRTFAAVREFQHEHGVTEDGIVGPETWSALVDATFTLGDRLLYLRFPHFHGRDVKTLQGVLNALGFACGAADGIFGAFTERAVREFQLNVGQQSDGIVGADTVGALMRLKHVWDGKDPEAPITCKVAPARAAEALTRADVVLLWEDDAGRDVAERIANLAVAAQPEARVRASAETCDSDVLLRIRSSAARSPAREGIPVVAVADEPSGVAARVVTALASEKDPAREIVVELWDADPSDERSLQATAVGILDGLCSALA